MDRADIIGFEPVDSEGSSLRVDYAPPLGETMARRVKVFVGNKEYEMDMDQYRRQASQGVAGMSSRQLVESASIQPGAIADRRSDAWNAYEQAKAAQQPNFAPSAPYPYPQPQAYPQPAQYEQAAPPQAQYPPQALPSIMGRPPGEPQIDIRQDLAVLQQVLSDSLYQVNENVLALGGMLAPQAAAGDLTGLFAATPQDPQVSVDFQLHEFGTITIPYHDVFVDNINVALAYDTRYKGGQGQYVPAPSRADGPPLQLFVRRPDGSIEGPFSCVSFGNTIRFGHMQLVVLMRELPQQDLLTE